MGTNELVIDKPGNQTEAIGNCDKQARTMPGEPVSTAFQNRCDLGEMKGLPWLQKYQLVDDRTSTTYTYTAHRHGKAEHLTTGAGEQSNG
jgi:hypothetical protein